MGRVRLSEWHSLSGTGEAAKTWGFPRVHEHSCEHEKMTPPQARPCQKVLNSYWTNPCISTAPKTKGCLEFPLQNEAGEIWRREWRRGRKVSDGLRFWRHGCTQHHSRNLSTKTPNDQVMVGKCWERSRECFDMPSGRVGGKKLRNRITWKKKKWTHVKHMWKMWRQNHKPLKLSQVWSTKLPAKVTSRWRPCCNNPMSLHNLIQMSHF